MRRGSLLLPLLVALAAGAACDNRYSAEPGTDDAGTVARDAGTNSASVNDASADEPPDASTGTEASAATDALAPGIDGGACGAGCHAMFVTSTTSTGNLGGESGADKKCQLAAAASMLPAISSRAARFVAWISTGNSGDPGIAARLPLSGTFARVDGKLIAGSVGELLSGTIRINIVEDENGSAVATGNLQGAAWTGTAANGKTSMNTCTAWSGTNGGGDIGKSSDSTSTWTEGGPVSCAQAKHLYCIELY